jgi:hypothetical protein
MDDLDTASADTPGSDGAQSRSEWRAEFVFTGVFVVGVFIWFIINGNMNMNVVAIATSIFICFDSIDENFAGVAILQGSTDKIKAEYNSLICGTQVRDQLRQMSGLGISVESLNERY